MLLDAVLLPTLVAALLSAVARRRWWCEAVTLVANVLTFALTIRIASLTVGGRLSGAGGWLYVDALSALTMLIVGFVGAAAALYSIGYMREDVRRYADDGDPTVLQGARRYYALFNLFLFSMLVVPASNSLSCALPPAGMPRR